MSVVIETTIGDITVDLYINDRPRACLNFLKLCKIKYYNYNLFHTISRGFIAQTGDPTGSRGGGQSIYGVLDGPEKKYFEGENEPRIKHTKMGLISFVGNEERMIGSQFFLTLGEDLTYLDEKHCVFGEVVEGFDILEILNEVICENDDRPYQDVRITHTVILDDPFPDPKRLHVPSRSPSPSAERLQGGRIAPDEEIDETEGKTVEEVVEMQAEREAKARATILEMVGDLPDAEMAPPENVLFVCKLNPVTTDDDLEIIFSRFGKIKSCEVIRDKKTGDSLQYAFVEFEDKMACENAYFKMDNVLIDDRRIHVDFSQSVSKVKWRGKGRGVTHYDEKGRASKQSDRDIGKGNYKHGNNYNYKENNAASRRKQELPRNGNRKQRNERYDSNSDRKYTETVKNTDRSDRQDRKKSPQQTEKRRRYSKSPERRRDDYQSAEKRKYSRPTRGEAKYKSDRYRKRSESPGRRDRNKSRDLQRRNKSRSPRRTGKDIGPSKKSRRRSTSEESNSNSDENSKRNTSKATKLSKNKERKKSPYRKHTKNKQESDSDSEHEEKSKSKKNKKRSSKYSSSEKSESEDDVRLKKKNVKDKLSKREYYTEKSEKKKAKKNKHESSSDSEDYKKNSKKKKKYESDSS